MPYTLHSNGDQYDGDWVMGKRHGQGMLRTAQGTIYDVSGLEFGRMMYIICYLTCFHINWVHGLDMHLHMTLT